MRPYTVISTFKAAGGYVSPPGPWTPPNERAAERLIKAGCLRLPTGGEEKRLARKDQPAERPAPSPMERAGQAEPIEQAEQLEQAEQPEPAKRKTRRRTSKKAT